MTGLLGSLGFDQVSADPNEIPDGEYDGIVAKSELVFNAKKNEIAHVVTYKVDGGVHNGAQKIEWNKLGENPVQADGSPATSLENTAGLTPTQTDQNKTWHKKRLVDLGMSEVDIANDNFGVMVGKKVTFGLKTKNGYQNVTYVNPRQESGITATPQGTPVSVGQFQQASVAAAPQPAQPAVAQNAQAPAGPGF